MKLNAKSTRWLVVLGILAITVPIVINTFYLADCTAVKVAWNAGDALSYCGSILGAVATIGAVCSTISYENDVRIDEERKRQARQVSAWFGEDRLTQDDSTFLRVATLQNASETPVYNVIVTCVGKEGAGPPHSGVDCGSEYKNRCCISVLPPGLWEVDIPTSGNGMGVIVSLEVAFCDSAGWYWVRSGDGKICGIDTSPVDYYGIGLPVSWGECRRPVRADVS